MNLTLAVDDRLVEQARKVAESQGKSLNQVIREYLEELTSPSTVAGEMEDAPVFPSTARDDPRGGSSTARRSMSGRSFFDSNLLV